MKKLKRSSGIAILLFLVAAFLQGHPAAAQSVGAGRISGQVLSEATGGPVAGATITVKGTKNSVKAGEDGQFSILAASGGTWSLRVSVLP